MNRIFSSLAALCIACPAPVFADLTDGVVELELLSGWRTADGTHMAGLQITLAPGWKTYWRVPGDGGIPPRFAWDGSENLGSVDFHWPIPDVHHINGLRSIGYEDVVVVPVEVALLNAATNARMAGQVQIGVCEEICVPVTLAFDAELPSDGRRDPAIIASLIDQPKSASDAGVTEVSCNILPSDDGLEVTASLTMPPLGPIEEVVIETADQQVWVSEPDMRREGGTLYATSDMIHVDGGSFALSRSDMRITVFAGNQAVDIQGCAAG